MLQLSVIDGKLKIITQLLGTCTVGYAALTTFLTDHYYSVILPFQTRTRK